jgi:multicomponent K+:H+ antiporter subunit D
MIWIVLPIVLPALVAPLLILLRLKPDLQRRLSLGATALLLAGCLGLYGLAADGTVRPYFLGAWPAPFGIALVLDRLSATMVLLTAVLASAVAIYAASTEWDRRVTTSTPCSTSSLWGLTARS